MNLLVTTVIIWSVLFSIQEITGVYAARDCKIKEVGDPEWETAEPLGNFKQNEGMNIQWHALTDIDNIDSCKELKFSVTGHRNISFENIDDWTSEDQLDVDRKDSPIVPPGCRCNFTCKTTSTLTISYGIEDTNDHDPQFMQSTYEATIPMPLIPKIDYTIFFSQPIIVKDADFSTKGMLFEIDPPDFEVITTDLGKKAFSPKLIAKALTRFDSERTYILKATDSSADPKTRTSQATLTLKVNASQSEPEIPTFSKAFYKFTYDIKDGKGHLRTDDILQVYSASANVNLALTGDDLASDITTSFDKTKHVVVLSATDFPDVKIKGKETAYLTLSATIANYEYGNNVTIMIDLPSKESPPEFTNAYYEYECDASGNLKPITDKIQVKGANTVAKIDSGDPNNKYFTMKPTNSNTVYDLTVQDFTGLKKLEVAQITLKLVATKQGVEKEGVSAIVVNFPIDLVLPHFDKPQYTAKYNDNKTITWVNGPMIIKNQSPKDVNLKIDGDFSSNFDLVTLDHVVYNIAVLKPPDEALKIGKPVTFLIEAKHHDATSSVPITLDFPPKLIPEFTEKYYQGSCDMKQNSPVDTNEPIKLSNKYADNTTIALGGDYKDYFQLNRDEKDSSQFSLSTNDKVLPTDKKQYVVTLKASLNDAEASSLVLVTAANVEIPEFSQIHYSRKYNTDTKTWNVIDKPIALKNKNVKDTTIKVTDPTGVFDIKSYDGGNVWRLVVLASELTATQYVLTLEANLKDVKAYATAIVAVTPASENEVPIFSQENYVVQYAGKVGTLEVISGPISLKNEHVSDTHLSFVDSGGLDYFKLSQDDANPNQWNVLVDSPISSPAKEYILTIAADLQGVQSKATLVVTTPDVEIPTFTKPQYLCTYDAKNDLHMKGDSIQLANKNIDSTSITLIDPEGKFDLSRDETDKKTYKLSVVDGAVLEKSQYMITLKANLDKIQTNATVIVVKDFGESPQFSNTFYIAEYDTAKKQITKDPQITLTNEHANEIDVSVIEGNKYVTVKRNTKDSKQWDIVITNIPSGTPNIAVKLQAKLNSNTATVVLVIDLVTTSTIIPTFSKPLYEATYETARPDDPMTIDSPVKIVSKNAAETSVEITNVADKEFCSLERQSSDSEIWDLSIIKVPPNVQQLTLLLEARLEDQTGHTTVAISFHSPDKVPPKLSQDFYVAKYKVDGSKAAVVLESKIKIVSNNPGDVSVDIAPGSEFGDNFRAENNEGEIKLTVVKNLNTTALKRDYIVIMLEASIENSGKTTASVAIGLPSSNGGNSDGQHGDSEGSGKTGLLAAVGVLVFIVLACFAAIGLLYCLKVRKRTKYGDMDDDDSMTSNDVRFSKNSKVPSLNGRKSNNSAATRRPTGFIRYPSALKEKDDAEAAKEDALETTPQEETKERRKSVAFDENVSKLQIEPIQPVSPEEVVTTQL